MSANFVGVTFAKQSVSPSDDAIIRANVLTDGILQGCAISYSGSTLTMAPGQMLVAGRQIRHPAAQNWAIVDATSGYARLVLTIDLTRTATKDSFDQVVDSIEYSLSPDGFAALEQGAINDAGTRYQIVICVVALGVGGISGVVSQVSECALIGSADPDTYLRLSGGEITGPLVAGASLDVRGPLILAEGVNYGESFTDKFLNEDPIGTVFGVLAVKSNG
jgi:hypothetical protein